MDQHEAITRRDSVRADLVNQQRNMIEDRMNTNHVFPRPCGNPTDAQVHAAAMAIIAFHGHVAGAALPLGPFRILTDAFHGDAVAAGWHHNIATGEPKKRNVGEMTMLAISELAEAMEGHRKKRMDDKLPHRPMLDVEIADFVIRCFDTIALPAFEGVRLDLSAAWRGSAVVYGSEPNVGDSLRCIVSMIVGVSDGAIALDAEHAKLCLARSIFAAFAFSSFYGLDLAGALVDKRNFNAIRQDHSVSARLAPDGKAY